MEALPSLLDQTVWLGLLALPVAVIAWTVTHEEIFREPREWLERKARHGATLARRKLAYLFTCEYCFSHWVALVFVALVRFRLLLPDWRGYVVGFFALAAVSNVYLTLFGLLRQQLKHETFEAQKDEREIERGD